MEIIEGLGFRVEGLKSSNGLGVKTVAHLLLETANSNPHPGRRTLKV